MKKAPRARSATGRGSSFCISLAVAVLGITTSANAAKNSFVENPLPGAAPFGEELVQKLKDAWEVHQPGYKPRTRHLHDDGSPKYTNRLFLSASPYLLQHAHNPVSWYPWGDEAFETAKRLGRPVLLSVGYSTCHWCHVMEEESFEDEEIARYLNEHYVAIKVDREERPDVDAIYMSAVQALTGGGGWPMTVWLTPDRKPFYGGTYFPARDGDRGTATGFLTLLAKLSTLYKDEPDRIVEGAAQLAQTVQQHLAADTVAEHLPPPQMLHEAVDFYRRNFDEAFGGPRRAPKFPSNLPIRLLLRYHRRSGDPQALHMATLTLEKMAGGGMHDQIGGGFHRYSTDERWLVPHFEKMLYDNALLAAAYVEAYQVTGREDFARVGREILRYVERDMTSPQGAFYSATDADSFAPGGHREEGWFFTWTPAEIDAALDPEQARVIKAYYAVTPGGNFEGRNILHTPRRLEDIAKELKLSPEKRLAILETAKESLYQARSKRPAPLRDEKILAAWNGLMISAYARAAFALDQPSYVSIGERAADFVLTRMRKSGRLFRSYNNGAPQHNAYLDDYAFLVAGLLDLYEATSDARWLREAMALDQVLQRHYEDEQAGGFFMTSDDHEKLLAREKPSYDGAEPSGNSVQALNLLRLHELTTEDSYRKRADRTLRAFGGVLERAPAALSEMLLALDFRTDTPKEIVIVAPESRSQAEPFLAELRKTYLPNRVLSVVAEGKDIEEQRKLIPLLEGKIARGGKTTAYVCERQVCDLPTSDPAVFAKQIGRVQRIGEEQGAVGRNYY